VATTQHQQHDDQREALLRRRKTVRAHGAGALNGIAQHHREGRHAPQPAIGRRPEAELGEIGAQRIEHLLRLLALAPAVRAARHHADAQTDHLAPFVCDLVSGGGHGFELRGVEPLLGNAVAISRRGHRRP
jgi:hypothetical protein